MRRRVCLCLALWLGAMCVPVVRIQAQIAPQGYAPNATISDYQTSSGQWVRIVRFHSYTPGEPDLIVTEPSPFPGRAAPQGTGCAGGPGLLGFGAAMSCVEAQTEQARARAQINAAQIAALQAQTNALNAQAELYRAQAHANNNAASAQTAPGPADQYCNGWKMMPGFYCGPNGVPVRVNGQPPASPAPSAPIAALPPVHETPSEAAAFDAQLRARVEAQSDSIKRANAAPQ